MDRSYHVGDWVVFTQRKQSAVPGPRAKDINPSPHGELYSYTVDKFWMVAEKRGSDELVLRTRRGKMHVVRANDRRLRKARWWERWLMKSRFPAPESDALSSSLSSHTES